MTDFVRMARDISRGVGFLNAPKLSAFDGGRKSLHNRIRPLMGLIKAIERDFHGAKVLSFKYYNSRSEINVFLYDPQSIPCIAIC